MFNIFNKFNNNETVQTDNIKSDFGLKLYNEFRLVEDKVRDVLKQDRNDILTSITYFRESDDTSIFSSKIGGDYILPIEDEPFYDEFGNKFLLLFQINVNLINDDVNFSLNEGLLQVFVSAHDKTFTNIKTKFIKELNIDYKKIIVDLNEYENFLIKEEIFFDYEQNKKQFFTINELNRTLDKFDFKECSKAFNRLNLQKNIKSELIKKQNKKLNYPILNYMNYLSLLPNIEIIFQFNSNDLFNIDCCDTILFYIDKNLSLDNIQVKLIKEKYEI